MKVREADLAELYRIRRAHDQYVRATQTMRRVTDRVVTDENLSRAYRDGWKGCLRAFSRAIVEAADPE